MNREPVPMTCPDIDATLARVRTIHKLCNPKPRDMTNVAEAIGILGDISSEADDILDDLEKLRKDNAKLREWGHNEARDADKLRDDAYELGDYLLKMSNGTLGASEWTRAKQLAEHHTS